MSASHHDHHHHLCLGRDALASVSMSVSLHLSVSLSSFIFSLSSLSKPSRALLHHEAGIIGGEDHCNLVTPDLFSSSSLSSPFFCHFPHDHNEKLQATTP